MPDLLLELRSEEIPARMQRKAAGDLKKLVTDALVEGGLTYEAARAYWTPRRLALDVRGVTARSKDVREERKGPSTQAPEQAVQGFLRSAGLTDISQAQIRSDPKKGDFYIAVIEKPGRAAEDIIAEAMPGLIRGFPWPKSMRWGRASAPRGTRFYDDEARGSESLRWVRPLQSILCTFGPETEEPVVVDFEIDGIRSGNVTYGHRFHAPEAITVRRFDDYVSKLEAAKVVLDAERRKAMIRDDAANLAFASGLELVEDEALLDEVSGLVEWPVVLMGTFEEAYLDIPAEVIRLTIRANQKCFVTRPLGSAPSFDPSGHLLPGGDKNAAHRPATSFPQRGEGGEAKAEPGEGALSNHFLLTANIEASDGGAVIAAGNGKVVRARLSDALYFWKTDQADLPDLDQLEDSAGKLGLDLKKPLDQRMARLDHLGVTFHAKLGTQGERVERIARLAEELAPVIARSITPSSGPSGHLLPGGEKNAAAVVAASISPLEGEMSPKATEGDGDAGRGEPPSALPGIFPSRGEITLSAHRAALLAKADLQTEVVGEFPELQGAMGRKYALLQGENASVAAAIEEHYKPLGPTDVVPTDPVSIAVALADKLDTLVGFWAIDEKPTGSKDPYALRRAALGVIRIVVENGVRLGLVIRSIHTLRFARVHINIAEQRRLSHLEASHNPDTAIRYARLAKEATEIGNRLRFGADAQSDETPLLTDLLSFFHDRLKVYLRDQGARHDLIDAVLASGGSAPTIPPLEGEMSPKATEGGDEVGRGEPPSALPGISPSRGEIGQSSNDDLLLIVRRVSALGALLDTEDGRNLLAGTKRAANILAAEEKKGTVVADAVDPALLKEPEEKALAEAVGKAEKEASAAIEALDYEAAMRALAILRAPIDAFFDKVLVNDPDEKIRANRLALLARIREATGQVADFSKISG